MKSVRCLGMSRAKFEEEAAILGMVQHPNVVRLIGCGYIEKSDTGRAATTYSNNSSLKSEKISSKVIKISIF